MINSYGSWRIVVMRSPNSLRVDPSDYPLYSGAVFINIETSPRIQSMGGSLIAIYDNDLSLTQTTPSLLNGMMNDQQPSCFKIRTFNSL